MIKDLKSEIKLLLTVALTRVPSSNLSWTKKQFSVQLKVWTPLTFLLLIMYSFNEDEEFMEGFKINFTGCVEWKQQSTIKEGWHPKSLKILIFLCWKRDFCNNFLIPPIAKPYFIKNEPYSLQNLSSRLDLVNDLLYDTNFLDVNAEPGG